MRAGINVLRQQKSMEHERGSRIQRIVFKSDHKPVSDPLPSFETAGSDGEPLGATAMRIAKWAIRP